MGEHLTDPGPDLSLEFLMGRALDNAMLNVGLKDVAKGRLLEVLNSHGDRETDRYTQLV